jgi:quercetin dioxygenase-like cupin family protein
MRKQIFITTLKSTFTVVILIVYSLVAIAQNNEPVNTNPQPKSILLNLDSDLYQEIVGGPPTTVGMYSGLVSLLPGDTVGHHNTEDYEEILVILKGEGQMIFDNKESLALNYGIVAYCPPHTEHNVKNTGTLPLQYIYVAAKTRK